jgi:4'-phosphopantetheinyl transferase
MQKSSTMSEINSWLVNPGPLALADHEIHVWRAKLDCGDSLLRRFEATLAADEKVRAARFIFQPDRNSFIAARGILRELLSRYLNLSAEQIEFDYCPSGKPFLRRPLDPPLQFNISHSHGLAVLSFSPRRHLGVDVELVRPDFSGDEIAARYFSPPEIVELRALPSSLRAEGFFLCWTLKEAYVKARGEGLNIPLASFDISFTPGRPERLRSSDSERWSLCSFRPDSRYVGALVAEGAGWQPRYWDWQPRDPV